MKALKCIAVTFIVFTFFGCSPSAEQLKSTLEKNPDIVINMIEKNPDVFVETLNKAFQKQRGKQRNQRAAQEKKQREQEYANPKKPKIDSKRAMQGPKNAPITIVEYSDFQCPYCSRGYSTIQEVKKKYGKKIRLIYKHLPLSFHAQAMPAAKYFEAIALQSPKKAYKFHDIVFENQQKLTSDGEKFLKATAKKVGANMSRVKKDLNSKQVTDRISEDVAEAQSFNFSGTPAFLVNGISLKGAYPASAFSQIIDRHLAGK